MTGRASGSGDMLLSSRSIYSSPSVHEVALHVQFGEHADMARLERFPEDLPGRFSARERLEQVRLEFSPSGIAGVDKSPAGWKLEEPGKPWVVQAHSDRLTFHFVRSKGWPSGPYAGWEAISAMFAWVTNVLSAWYVGLPVKMLGLRYINLIAVPKGTNPAAWLNVGAFSPADSIGKPEGFRVRQEWLEVVGFPTFAAAVNCASIEVGDLRLASSNYGLLLDIDVHSGRAFALEGKLIDTPEWFERAHAAENFVFERCITDQLRARFNEERT